MQANDPRPATAAGRAGNLILSGFMRRDYRLQESGQTKGQQHGPPSKFHTTEHPDTGTK